MIRNSSIKGTFVNALLDLQGIVSQGLMEVLPRLAKAILLLLSFLPCEQEWTLQKEALKHPLQKKLNLFITINITITSHLKQKPQTSNGSPQVQLLLMSKILHLSTY